MHVSLAAPCAVTMHPIWSLVSRLTAQRVYTRVLGSNSIYLTFDDGPDSKYTPQLIEVLAAHHAKATFFLRGDNCEKHGDLTRRLIRAGHALGNHSYSHPRFDKITRRRQREEIERTDQLLAQFDGRARHLFRPPYGSLTLTTAALCLHQRQRVALWTHDSLDFRLDREAVLQRLRGLSLRGGDILLFHDDCPAGIEALDRILPEWRAAGYEFAAL